MNGGLTQTSPSLCSNGFAGVALLSLLFSENSFSSWLILSLFTPCSFSMRSFFFSPPPLPLVSSTLLLFCSARFHPIAVSCLQDMECLASVA